MRRARWGLELLLYAVIAIGCGLLVWDVVGELLDLPTIGSREQLSYEGLAAVACAVVLLRRLPADRVKPPVALRIVALVVPLAIGAAAVYAWTTRRDSIVFRNRELPGLTIALPEGKEAPNPQHAASIMIEEVRGRATETAVAVTWQIGQFDDAIAQRIASASATRRGATATPAQEQLVVGDGIPHRAFHVAASAGEQWVILFGCGTRLFGVFVGGDRSIGLVRQILASVRCHPAPADAQAGVPVVVDLPPSWQRGAGEAGQLTYQAGSEMLVIQAIDLIADEQLQGTVDAAARKLGPGAKLGPKHEVASADGARFVWPGTLADGSDSIPFHIALWRCTARELTLLIFHLGGDGDERSAFSLFEHLRCARPDEPSTH